MTGKRTKMEETSDMDWSAASDEELLSLSTGNSSPSKVNQSDAITPEALIRKETKAIGFFRVLVASILGFAAIALSLFVFFFTRSVERSAFKSDFQSSASRLAETFVDIMYHRLESTKTLAAAITSTMEAQGSGPTNFSLTPSRMRELTQQLLLVEKATIATWSPLLQTDEERLEFELFVQSQRPKQAERCYLCGSPSRKMAHPDAVVHIIGHGAFECSQAETAALNGGFRDVYCDYVASLMFPVCGCVDADTTLDDVPDSNTDALPSTIFGVNEGVNEEKPVPYGKPPYSPIWEVYSLASKTNPVLYDLYNHPSAGKALELVVQGNNPVTTESFDRKGPYYEMFDIMFPDESSAMIIGPVYDSRKETIVGFTMTDRPWKRLFLKTKEAFSNNNMVAVIQNTCGQELVFTPNFRNGSLDSHDSWSDLSDPDFVNLAVASSYEDYEKAIQYGSPWPLSKNHSGIESRPGYCLYRIVVYPTVEHRKSFMSQRPTIFASITLFSFLFSAIIFYLYDRLVRRRQHKVMQVAVRTDSIVTSLYPENVRNRLFQQLEDTGFKTWGKQKIENLFDSCLGDASSEPIADMFPSAVKFNEFLICSSSNHCLISYATDANFTVWSSERNPRAIFTLLECIYGSLDIIAGRLGVFKVETIGDAYVAVCGLPSPNKEHAVVMARFGALCLAKFAMLVQSLEVRLGPSTGDLRARVGLHSGPIVAGVLRGTKARFQLFGDTVNTASRLESTARPMHIHATRATCDLLRQAGKGHWIRERCDIAVLKGKASSKTFWVNPNLTSSDDDVFSSKIGAGKNLLEQHSNTTGIAVVVSENSERKKVLRLVEWNVEVLFELLQAVVAFRQRETIESGAEPVIQGDPSGQSMVVDEFVPVLDLPPYDIEKSEKLKNAEIVTLPGEVRTQLRDFVLQVAMSYHDVPFHNFDHASHVVMSARNLMQHVVEPGDIDFKSENADAQIHQSTYGISSDLLMRFTVVFSSLIHDCGHTGLTNEELSRLDNPLAKLYRNKSIAEQNSVDTAWAILMEPRFKALRACIYTEEAELLRFRQLLVNAVISTDLADAQLKSLREGRWEAAFLADSEGTVGDIQQHDANRRATVIYEYIIQAADVAHTMQHWNTYQKFNRRLFEERYVAWVNGYAENEPSVGWYQGEIGFFDFYIIPLARKLNRCGVFGASYDALVTYALENKKEWEQKGEEIVEKLRSSCQTKYGTRKEPNKETMASLSEMLSVEL